MQGVTTIALTQFPEQFPGLSLQNVSLITEHPVRYPPKDLVHSIDKTDTTRKVWKQNMLNSLTNPGLSLPSRVTYQRWFGHYNLKIRLVSSHQRERAIRLFSRLRRSEEHTSELQSRENLVCRLLLEKK